MCSREQCADEWSAVKFGVKTLCCQQINTPPAPWVPLPLQAVFLPADVCSCKTSWDVGRAALRGGTGWDGHSRCPWCDRLWHLERLHSPGFPPLAISHWYQWQLSNEHWGHLRHRAGCGMPGKDGQGVFGAILGSGCGGLGSAQLPWVGLVPCGFCSGRRGGQSGSRLMPTVAVCPLLLAQEFAVPSKHQHCHRGKSSPSWDGVCAGDPVKALVHCHRRICVDL